VALHLVRYPELSEVVVHRADCTVWTNASRVFQVSPVVRVHDDWRVRMCSVCCPVFGVVSSRRWVVAGRGDQMVARFGAREERRRLRRDLDVPASVVPRKGWKADADCRSGDERLNGWLQWLFLSDAAFKWQVDVARSICEGCAVRVDCLLAGVWGEEPWGLWGGATPSERQVLLKRWRKERRVSPRESGRLDGHETMAV